MRATDGLTDAVTVLSQHLATELAQRRVAASSHIHVIPNSVDVARFAMRLYGDRTRELFRVARDQFLWLAVGRLDEAKDYPNLLNAFSALSKSHPNTLLMIAGDGPLKSDLHSMVQRMDMDSRVHLLGLRQDMPAIYAASDALVLSSAWEGMPNVVLEAMAFKNPCGGNVRGRCARSDHRRGVGPDCSSTRPPSLGPCHGTNGGTSREDTAGVWKGRA